MGRHGKYIPGSFYRVDDRTGFVQRAERTQKEWTGAIVDRERWEPRQPQDYVKGVKDDQSVPDARPLNQDVFVGPVSTPLAQALSAGGTHIFPTDTFWPAAGADVGIMLDSGSVWRTTVTNPQGDGSFYLTAPLPSSAAAGNLVTSYGTTG